MKLRHVFFLGALVLGITLMSARENKAEGMLHISCVFNGKPAPNTLVGVADSEDNFDESIYIFEDETGADGKISFGPVGPGTYWIDGMDDYENFGETSVEVEGGDVNVTLTLTAD